MTWGHPAREAMIDAAEGRIDAATRLHLAACESCRDEVAAMAAAIAAIRTIEVPEPSPLFWNHLSQRVRDAIASDAVPPRNDSGRFTWKRALPWAVPLPVAAALAIALIWGGAFNGQKRPTVPAPSFANSAPLPSSEDEVPEAPDTPDWDLLVAVSDTLPDGDTSDSAALSPGAANLAVASLSNDERAALARLLRDELGGPVL